MPRALIRFERRFWDVSGFCGQPEIHLLFGRIHLRHLHFHHVAEPDHPAGAAANELTALLVVDIKIVLHGGQRHETAHRQTGHVHKEAEIQQIRHQGRITGRLAGSQLRLEEGKHLYIFAIAFGISRIAFGVRNVLGGFLQRQPGGVLFLKQRTMHHQVGIAAYGRGEVRVFSLRQAVMAERVDVVTRPPERLQEADLERLADGQRAEFLEQFLDLKRPA